MRFDLNSPSLAQYNWGTLFCRFSPAAPVGERTYVETFASLVAGLAPWNTDREFCTTVALLHEVVHLAQDVTTGLGHADYLTHLTQTHNLLHYASLVLWMDGSSTRPPYRQPGSCPSWLKDNEDSIVTEAHEQLRYYPFNIFPRKQLEKIRELLQIDFNQQLISDEFLFDISTQSILESDAAATVFDTVKSLRMTDAQFEILQQNTDVFSFDKLSPEYSRASQYLIGILCHHAALEEDELRLVFPSTFGLFVDSALACPPFDWIQARGETAAIYEPSVKYMRLLIAFQKLVGAEMDQFWSALASNRMEEAERLLLTHTSYPYPSTSDIYDAWINALNPWVSEKRVANLRNDACRYRLNNGTLQQSRSIRLLNDMEFPFLYLDDESGFGKTDWGMRILDREIDIGLTFELVDHSMLIELAEFLFRTGEFRCPHAIAQLCSAAEDVCMSGFLNQAQLPESKDCRARSVLIQCGVIPTIP